MVMERGLNYFLLLKVIKTKANITAMAITIAAIGISKAGKLSEAAGCRVPRA
jgi:hypothetical protein